MRLIIFASLGLCGISVAASGFSTTTNAPSEELFKGTVSTVYSSDTISVDGYGSHFRLAKFSRNFSDRKSELAARQSLASSIEGRPISCKKVDMDNYGAVVVRCWDFEGDEITQALIGQDFVTNE